MLHVRHSGSRSAMLDWMLNPMLAASLKIRGHHSKRWIYIYSCIAHQPSHLVCQRQFPPSKRKVPSRASSNPIMSDLHPPRSPPYTKPSAPTREQASTALFPHPRTPYLGINHAKTRLAVVARPGRRIPRQPAACWVERRPR